MGEYREVIENERLVYTEFMSDENGDVLSSSDTGMPPGHPTTTEVNVELRDVGGRTKMVMTHRVVSGRATELVQDFQRRGVNRTNEGHHMSTHSDSYFGLDDRTLDLLIADHLLAGELGAKDVPAEEKYRMAESWFESKLALFRSAVCESQPVQVYVHQKTPIDKELCDALIGALALVSGGLPVPLGILAAKILRYGLSRLCPSLAEQPT